MPILNYTTTIAAHKTAGEVVLLLAKHGASTVASFYENGQPSGIAFSIDTEFGLREFRLPANASGVLAVLKKEYARGQVRQSFVTQGQAERIAWRILKDWIAAQLAIIDAGMTTLDEVMLPYMITPSGNTFAVSYRERERAQLAIEAAS